MVEEVIDARLNQNWTVTRPAHVNFSRILSRSLHSLKDFLPVVSSNHQRSDPSFVYMKCNDARIRRLTFCHHQTSGPLRHELKWVC